MHITLESKKNFVKKCGDNNSDGNLIIKLEKSLNSKYNELDNNSICKTKNIVSRLDNYLNAEMIKDELKNKFNFKKSNNHIIRNCKDNVSYGKIFS